MKPRRVPRRAPLSNRTPPGWRDSILAGIDAIFHGRRIGVSRLGSVARWHENPPRVNRARATTIHDDLGTAIPDALQGLSWEKDLVEFSRRGGVSVSTHRIWPPLYPGINSSLTQLIFERQSAILETDLRSILSVGGEGEGRAP